MQTLTATISTEPQWLVRTRLPRGTSKLDTRTLTVKRKETITHSEMMPVHVVLTLDDSKYKIDPAIDLDLYDDDEMIEVWYDEVKVHEDTYKETRLSKRESHRKTRAKDVPEELADAIYNHPFAPDDVIQYVNRQLGYFSTHAVTNIHPFALIFLNRGPDGKANVSRSFLVEVWDQTSAKVRDEADNLILIHLSPEVMAETEIRDGIVYFPQSIKVA